MRTGRTWRFGQLKKEPTDYGTVNAGTAVRVVFKLYSIRRVMLFSVPEEASRLNGVIRRIGKQSLEDDE